MSKYVGYYVEILQDNNDDLSDQVSAAINSTQGPDQIRTLKPFKQNREEDYKKFNELANFIVTEAEKGREFSSFEEANNFGHVMSSIMSQAMVHVGHSNVIVNNKIAAKGEKFVLSLKAAFDKRKSPKGRPLGGNGNGKGTGKPEEPKK